jgi:hypothetical protein
MSAAQTATAMTRRDGLPLATVKVPGQPDVQLCNYDALHYAKTLVRNGFSQVTLVTEGGRRLTGASAILAARF